MTLRDLKKVWVDNKTQVCITAVAYFKTSKKYYSFRNLDWGRRLVSFTDAMDKYLLDLQIKSINPSDGKLYIEVIEWIDDIDEDEESA